MRPSRRAVVIAAALTAVCAGAVSSAAIVRSPDPGPASQVSATVGPAGTRVTFRGGWLEVPAGAVATQTILHVRQAPPMPPGAPVTQLTHQLGTGVAIDLSGTQPAKRLRLGLAVTALPAGTSELLAIATASGGARPHLVPATYDAAGRTLVAEIDHLSDLWAVAIDVQKSMEHLAGFMAQVLKQRAPKPGAGQEVELDGRGLVSFAPGAWQKPPDPWLWGTLTADAGKITASLTNNRSVGFAVAPARGLKIQQDSAGVDEGFTRLVFEAYQTVYGGKDTVLTAGSSVRITTSRDKVAGDRDPGGMLLPVDQLKIATLRPHPMLFAAVLIQAAALDLVLLLAVGNPELSVIIGDVLAVKGIVSCLVALKNGMESAITKGPPALSELVVGQQLGLKCLSLMSGILFAALGYALAGPLGAVAGAAVGVAVGKFLPRIIELISKNLGAATAAWELDAMTRTIPQSFDVSLRFEPGPIDWRNRSYYLTGDDLTTKPELIDVVKGRGTGSGWEVEVEQVASGRLAQLGDVTAVLLRIHPVAGNYFTQELRVFHRDGRYIGRTPTLPRHVLYPWYQAGTLTFPGGLLAAHVKFYGPGDSHASGPSIDRLVRWRWDGAKFLPVSGVYRYEPPPTPTPNGTVTVQANQGWQDTGIDIPGKFNVSDLKESTWSVDSRNHPYVGANGYSAEDDQKIAQGYKYDPGKPYGYLLGKLVAGGDERVIPIGEGGLFENPFARPARLYLRINDVDQALGDNAGSLTVDVNPWPSE